MVVLHAYSPAPPHWDRGAPTRAALGSLSPAWRGRVHSVAVGDDDRYEAALRARWGRDDLIVLEHDVEPVGDALAVLARCPHPLCAWAYALTWEAYGPAWVTTAAAWDAATRQDHPLVRAMTDTLADIAALHQRPGGGAPAGSTWAHRVITDPADPRRHQRWVRRGERWADLVGLGCTKIARGVQRSHAPGWRAGPWRDLDSRLSWHLYDAGAGPWHLHWPPLPHHHGCPCHPEAAS